MKTRIILYVFMVLIFPTIIIASGNKKEELYGTWINEEYKGTSLPLAILIYKPDGTYQYCRLEAASWEQDIERTKEGWIKSMFGTYKIAEKRTDDEGNIWYKIEKHITANKKHFVLIKIDCSGNILEYVYRQAEFAEDIDPNAATYGIYYRQE
jgi:hypothetical protein